MKSEMFFPLFDLFITCFELGGYFYLIKAEQKNKRHIILYFITLIAMVIISSSIALPVLAKYIITILFMTIGGSMTLDCNIFKNLLYGIIYVFSIQCSEVLTTQLWLVINPQQIIRYYSNMDISMISLVITSKSVYFLFIAIFQKIMQSNEDSKIKPNEIIPVLISGIPFILVLEYLTISLTFISDNKLIIFSLSSSIFILLIFILNMIFTQHYNDVKKKALREEQTIYELKLKYEYYKRKKEDEELIRELYHDLKNHFLICKDNFVNEELKRKLSSYENYYITGNELLDVIISNKLSEANNCQIQVDCNIDFTEGGFIDALDISTIFGNLLDNAIEACAKLPESEKFIWINAGKKQNLFFIKIKNTTINKDYKKIHNSIRTDKSNKYLHGFGISNVKKAVRKYDGECSISYGNGMFEISIIIPMPGKIIGT